MTDLITRLSKLDAPCSTLTATKLANQSPFKGEEWALFIEALKGSVDAAIALAERVLPGWVFDNVGQDFHSVPGGYEAFGWNVELINGTRVQGQAPTFPLAICIALLRAKEASR